ncbi:hypothetical protein [Bradyrhizobium arachidis]|uniref:Uncharacterized protein n=1 Tax=Bradyrhizobium arachidis TaxID=858423 RepID=A0AAE7NTA3_9BRAD|nr:hypothetical protein [Bradyrhizobium arachidis]QOZ69153.1 hypothetical protein WN72_24645 [Bradyrhizobium arachidis]SFV01145.1 hypothetical protein SAMN05192541_109306 [Bradyrhizobium arachidis]
MRTKDHTTQRVDFPEPQHVWSAAEGNYHAPYRHCIYDLKAYEPPPDVQSREIDEHVSSVILYVRPGERMSTRKKRLWGKLIALLDNPSVYPERAEIEFSSPWGISLPKDYRTSVVDWALSACNVVLVCVDERPGLAEGEAHRVLAPLQVVFRCREQDVQAWTEYLQPRLKGRHRLHIVHPHIPVGRA